ncbi:MAG: pirin family protein [Nocardioidaceae bacterium]
MSTFATLHEPIEPRDVLLGRTTHVRRLIPNRARRMIGAWCFLDHYGPDDVKETGGMWVPPHPHTGLQTVTWLFEGEGLHTDSLGSEQLIEPGQLNVMTAGAGICHAEVSPESAPQLLHGVQLWVALPDAVRNATPPDFTHIAELPTYEEAGVRIKVLVGELAAERSPAPTFTPLVGAELRLRPGAAGTIPLDPAFEHGVLTTQGTATVAGAEIARNAMSYLGDGLTELAVSAPDVTKGDTEEDTVLLLLGGEPFDEEIVMWWNFIGRSHEEIVEQRQDWNGEGLESVPERFGRVESFAGDRLLAPPMPNTRLKPRGRASA